MTPSRLVLDEAAEGVEPRIAAAIRDVLAALNGRTSVLLAEQSPDVALGLADGGVVLSRGAIATAVWTDSPTRDQPTRPIAVEPKEAHRVEAP